MLGERFPLVWPVLPWEALAEDSCPRASAREVQDSVADMKQPGQKADPDARPAKLLAVAAGHGADPPVPRKAARQLVDWGSAARQAPLCAFPLRRVLLRRRAVLQFGAPSAVLLRLPARPADGHSRESAPAPPKSRGTSHHADSPMSIATPRPQAARSSRAAVCAPSLFARVTSAITRFPNSPNTCGAYMRHRQCGRQECALGCRVSLPAIVVALLLHEQ